MLIGYARVSKGDGSQTTDLQRDALVKAGVESGYIYEDAQSGSVADRPGLKQCLRALRAGDTLVVWKLDRLGRSLRHLVDVVEDLNKHDVGFRSITEGLDTTTPGGVLIFNIIGSLAQFERDLIRERTMAGLAAARSRGRKGGRPRVSVERLLGAAAAMKDPAGSPKAIAREYGLGLTTLYRYIAPDGSEREPMQKLLAGRMPRSRKRTGSGPS